MSSSTAQRLVCFLHLRTISQHRFEFGGGPTKSGLCVQRRHTPFAGACFLYLLRFSPAHTPLNGRLRFSYSNDFLCETGKPFGLCATTVTFPSGILTQPKPGKIISVFSPVMRKVLSVKGGKSSKVFKSGGDKTSPT